MPTDAEVRMALSQARAAGDNNAALQLQAELDRRSSENPNPSLAQVGAGVTVEIASGLAGQTAGAALAPATLGISYPVLAFSGGVSGSIAAQKIEGREDISVGRALFAGLINLIPGSSAAKGAVKTANASVKMGRGAKALQAAGVAAKDATRGAAIGTGEAVAVSTIDKGRLPTFEEFLTYGGAGAGGNVLFSSLGRAGARLWNKVKGKTPDQIDSMVAKGEILPTDLDSIPELASAAESIVVKAQNKPAEVVSGLRTSDFIASVAPSKTLGKEIQDAAISYKNEIYALDELGSKIAKKVDGAIAKSPNPERSRQAVDAFMNGKTDALPRGLEKLETDLVLAREKIGELQDQIIRNIDTGISPQAEGVRDTIVRSREDGDYLTREFEFFTNRKYSPTNKQRDAVIQEIAGENIFAAKESGGTITTEAARSQAISYLNEINKKKLSNVDDGSFYPTAMDGVLRRKKELGPALLDYLGEIKAPGERAAGTISRLGRVAQRDATDAKIAELLESTGLATREPREGLAEISLKRMNSEGTGLYAEPGVQRALKLIYTGDGERASSNMVLNSLSDVYQAGVSGSKAAKVLLNPPSYAVQVYGNSFNLMGMGINPLGPDAYKGMRLALSEYGPIENLAKSPEARKALLEDVYEMSRYGIKGANVLDSDIRSGLEKGIFQNVSQKALDPFSKAYTAPDTMGRFVAWKANQKTIKAMYPEASPEAVKRLAANTTNDTYQNYDRLSNTAKALSRIGIVPQFASFTMEFARNQWNQGRVIREMLQGKYGGIEGLGPANLEAMKAEGIRRLASLTALYGVSYGVITGLNEANGVDRETGRALQESVLPEYDEDSLLSVSYDAKTKEGKYMNPSYIVPHAIGLTMLDKGLRGEPIEGAIDVLTSEFVGEGSFVGKSIYGGIAGRDPESGRQISAESDKMKNAIDRVKWVIQDSFTPGAMREVQKAGAAKRGQGQLTKQDVALRQFGRRVNPFNVPERARGRIKQTVDNANLAKSKFKFARDYQDLSDGEIANVYESMNSAYRDAQQVNIRHAKNLAILGLSDDERIAVMKDAGMGSIDILNAMSGVVTDIPRVDRVTASLVWAEEVFPLDDKGRMERIREIGKTDPQMARNLIQRNKRDMLDQRRGIQSVDRLIMGLGVSDGTRAEWIGKQLQNQADPFAYIRSLQRKGIITKDVMLQLRRGGYIRQ